MSVFIGMDEAGYGPNLGPLVVTATAWEVPGPPGEFDWFAALEDVVAGEARRGDDRIHVADSKAVYSPSRGIAPLERGVLALLAARSEGGRCGGLRELWQSLSAESRCDMDDEPWFRDRDVSLPCRCDASEHEGLAARTTAALGAAGVRLRAVRSEIVLVARFNELVRRAGSKGVVLSKLSAGLLRDVWDPTHTEPTMVVCDKHGGRNRYDDILADVAGDAMVLRMEEGRERSRYRIGATDVRFQTKAEAHFPVAVASMVSKYVRELAMQLFNEYWQNHVPDVAPTKGYPSDAKRFRADVDEARKELGIDDDTFWRCR